MNRLFSLRGLAQVSMMVIFLLSTSAHANKQIKQAMKDQIGPAFKVILGDLKKGKMDSQTQAAAQDLIAGFTKIQNLVPDYIPDSNTADGVRPPNAEEANDFKEKNRLMLSISVLLARALANNPAEVANIWQALNTTVGKTDRPAPADLNNLAIAQEILREMGQVRKVSHDSYKPE